MDNIEIPKIPSKFSCEKCNYNCCNKKDYNKHLLTRKHLAKDNSEIPTPSIVYYCNVCNNAYQYRSGLSKHRKTCIPHQLPNEDVKILQELVKDLVVSNQDILKQNHELQKQVTEIVKNSTNIQTINNTQTNNQNNKFNINVYLNETCKDAINFSEFIENIEVSYQDLENNVQLGFVNGIAKIFTDNLKQLELHQRPIHCTDVKREVVYIKDNNVWTKQLNTDKLNYAVNVISHKGIKKLMMWKRENPEYQDVNSDFSNKCIDIQQSTMAGYNQHVYNPKVIHVIARETAIRK